MFCVSRIQKLCRVESFNLLQRDMVVELEVRNEEGQLLIETQPVWKKRRYHLVVLVFFGFINIYTLRVNLSVGIVGNLKHYF